MKDTALTKYTITAVCFFAALLAARVVSVQCKSMPMMQADEANNEIDDNYPSHPINVCLDRQPKPGQKINRRKNKGLLGQLVIRLKDIAAVAEKEMDFLSQRKQCDILPKYYMNHGIKNLNPRKSKKTNKKLKIPKNKKVQQLYETLWWLTSMIKGLHEVNATNKLSKDSTLLKEIEKISYFLQNILYSMNIPVPFKSSLCYREQTIEYPLKQRDYTKECAYAFLTLQDIRCGLTRVANVLGRCKISIKRRKGNSTAKLRCKSVKSVFYSRRRKHGKNTGCRRRRRLGTWAKLRL